MTYSATSRDLLDVLVDRTPCQGAFADLADLPISTLLAWKPTLLAYRPGLLRISECGGGRYDVELLRPLYPWLAPAPRHPAL